MVMNDQTAAPWARRYGSVYRFVRRRAVSREEAEDVTQEVFEAAVAALGQARLKAEPSEPLRPSSPPSRSSPSRPGHSSHTA